MNPILPFCTAALLSAFCALSASAQAQSPAQTLEDLMADPPATTPRRKDFTGRVAIFDSILVHPMPDWMPQEIQGKPLNSTRFNRQRNEKLFRLEMIPREESFKTWNNLYAVLGFRDYPGNNATHAREIIRGFNIACKPSNLNVRPLQGNPNIALLVIACGSFARQPDKGEVAAFVLLQRGKTAARLYREWRTAAFRSEDPNQWPVSRKTLDRVIGQMTRSRLMPLPAGPRTKR